MKRPVSRAFKRLMRVPLFGEILRYIAKISRDAVVVLRGNVGVVTASWVIFSLAWPLAYLYRSLYILALGGDYLTVALVNAINSVGAAISQVPGGYLADKIGRYRLIVTFTYAVSAMGLLYALVPNWQLFLLVTLIDSLFHIYGPALMAIVADSLPEDKRATGYAAINTLMAVSGIFGPPIAGYLYKTYGTLGLRMGYVIFMVLGLIASVLRHKFLKETLRARSQLKELLDKGIVSLYVTSIKEIYAMLARSSRGLLLLILVGMITTSVRISWGDFFTLYAIDIKQFDPLLWTAFFSATSFLSIFINLPLGSLVDRFDKTKVLSLSLVVYGSLLGIVPAIWASFPSTAELFVALLVRAIAVLVFSTLASLALSALRVELTSVEIRGKFYASVSILNRLCSVASSIVFGVIFSLNPDLYFYTSAFAIWTAALVSYLIKRYI